MLSEWPIDRPRNWLARVNPPETDAELAAPRQCVNRGSPFVNRLEGLPSSSKIRW
jgi:hypothetical protein